MNRIRTFLLSTLIAFLFNPAAAEVSGARLGVLGAPEEPRFSEVLAGLKRGLRELGYTEKTVEIIEGRVPRGDNATERVVIEKMVQQRIAVLFAIGLLDSSLRAGKFPRSYRLFSSRPAIR